MMSYAYLSRNSTVLIFIKRLLENISKLVMRSNKFTGDISLLNVIPNEMMS